MVARRLVALAASLILAASCTASAAAPSDALVDIGAGLQGPAGLVASVYAQGVTNVSAFALDAEGRLWLATAAYTDEGADAVYLVTAAGSTPVKVIDGLHTPMGLLWVGDELFVTSAGRVDAYGGFDGQSFATHRSVVTLDADVGQVNGIAIGSDGRLVVGISAPCDHCPPTSQQSASIVSFLPDGGDLRVDVSGVRAPIGLAFDPVTGRLLVTMNQRDDLGSATPGDWLAVVQAGQDWGFPDCYGQGGSECASQPGPLAALDQHAAVSGLAIANGELGTAIGHSAIVAEWAFGKVQRVALTTGDDGALTGTVQPFLTSLKNPVPVLLGTAGSLFVGDWTTGIVYRISASTA